MDEEFFFDASDTLLDHQREARDMHLELFGSQHTLSLDSADPIITQDRFDAAVEDLVVLSQTMKRRLPDLDALLPNFGCVSKEHIRDTLAKTSQHYQADKHIPMRKHFQSRFPAANVRHLNEWYSTDTFISDVPALDDTLMYLGVPVRSKSYSTCLVPTNL